MFQRYKNIYHLFAAALANALFRFPSRRIKVIGVTGTDGKTTTVNMIYHILKTQEMEVSMISSVGAVIDGKNYDVGFHVTTPSSWQLQRFIKMIKRSEKIHYLIMEVTSHALDPVSYTHLTLPTI